MIQAPVSDRERWGLHGPVKSVVDEWSATEFDQDGKILEWRGNTSHGRAERTYVYDENGRLIRISGSDGDQVDEFRYDEQGRKKQIRQIPARPEQGSRAYGIAAWFDCISEGDTLSDGGRVETMYNERDQPAEVRILDDEGMVLFRIVRTYDADGRLSQEKLTTENTPLPKAFRDQIPAEHRGAALAEMKAKFAEISQRTGLYGDAERIHVYNEQGRLAERRMRMGLFAKT
jgi:RHS Repeat